MMNCGLSAVHMTLVVSDASQRMPRSADISFHSVSTVNYSPKHSFFLIRQTK